MPHTQIAFFNHKGGVSKTTSVFNIGWMLASQGHRTLLVDCDPQCNLTGLVLNYDHKIEYEFQDPERPLNIRDALAPAFQARPVGLTPAEVQPVPQCDDLFVLPGHVGFAEYESQLAIAHDLSSAIPALQNIPGSIRWMLNATANAIDAEYVLVDMSPSLGSINQNLWASSDAFVVPMAPDYFSSMALQSLATILPRWFQWSQRAASNKGLKESAYPWPEITPKYLGSIVQNYRIRARDGKEAAPTRGYQEWFDHLCRTMDEVMIPAFSEIGLLLPEEAYASAKSPPSKFLLEVPDFNTLVAASQKHSKPVFTLTSDDLESRGVVAETQQQSVERFLDIYGEGATKIDLLARHVHG